MVSPARIQEVGSPAMLRMLFLCTHNSARSILSEALANHLGGGRVQAFSAGSRPSGRVNPHALMTLEMMGLPTAGLRSKRWDEFAGPAAPVMDRVVTVCGNAASESCPVWPGQPEAMHWGFEDPSATEGGDEVVAAAFVDTARRIAEKLRRYLDAELPRVSVSAPRSR